MKPEVLKYEIVRDIKQTTTSSPISTSAVRDNAYTALEQNQRSDLYGSSWVFACIQKVLSGLQLVEWNIDRSTISPIDEVSPRLANEFISRPTQLDWSIKDVIQYICYYLLINNELLLNFNFSRRSIDGRRITRPFNIELPLDNRYIVQRRLNFNRNNFIYYNAVNNDIPERQVLVFALGARNNCALDVVKTAVGTDNLAKVWNNSMLHNNASISAVMTANADYSEEQIADIRNEIASFSGFRRAGNVAFFQSSGGIDIQTLERPLNEMSFIDGRRFLREEICSVFGVPSVLFTQEGVTQANLAAARSVLWEDTIIPLICEVKDVLNAKLFEPFYGGLRINYDLAEVPAYADIVDRKVTVGRKAIEQAVATPREIIDKHNLPYDVENNEITDNVLISRVMRTETEVEVEQNAQAERIVNDQTSFGSDGIQESPTSGE